MNLWTRRWTKTLVASLEGADDAPCRIWEGRSARGEDRPGGDRFHRLLLRTKGRRVARLVRRDVLRRGQAAVSGAWLRRAEGGGSRLHPRGARKDQPIDEGSDEAAAPGCARDDLATDIGHTGRGGE